MKNPAKKRVVAYARVSTNKNDQKNSFENQQTFFLRELNRNPQYQLINRNIEGLCKNGIYADRGVSGTKLSRPAFDRMLLDAGLQPIVDADNDKKTTAYKINPKVKPKFDMICVKDTSRFARNVSINAILQTLRENNVYVYFLDLNKTTESTEDITYIQLFFSIAERESRDRSVKVSFGYEEGIKQGKIYFGGKMIGYDYDSTTNTLKANDEAELVKLVFDMYTEEGLGHQRICNKLAEMGYFNSVGNKYTRSTISRMLENEKYTGVTNTGRYHRPDLFSRKRITRDYDDPLRIEARNTQQRLLENGIVKIEPIISVEQFKKAQEIREGNCKKYNNNGTYHGITDYATKIKCGCCGGNYTAQSRKYNIETKSMIRYYACKHRFAYDETNGIPKCENPSVREDKLDEILNSNEYYELKLENIASVLEMGDLCRETAEKYINRSNDDMIVSLQAELKKLSDGKERLLDLYIDGTFDKSVLEKKTNEIEVNIGKVQAKITDLSSGNDKLRKIIAELDQRLKEARKEYKTIEGYIKTQRYPKIERRNLLRDIECITVHTDGSLEIQFKSITALSEEVANMSSNLTNFIDFSELEKQIETDLKAWEDAFK